MEKKTELVVHGRGNAWPVSLGEEHPFYDRRNYRDLSNAAYSLVVSTGGKVDADVNVRRISINGEFHGMIHVSERVEIHREGRVYGDIYCPCLIIDAGAIFEGRCNMSDSSMPKKDEGVLLKAVDGNPDITAKIPTKS